MRLVPFEILQHTPFVLYARLDDNDRTRTKLARLRIHDVLDPATLHPGYRGPSLVNVAPLREASRRRDSIEGRLPEPQRPRQERLVAHSLKFVPFGPDSEPPTLHAALPQVPSAGQRGSISSSIVE